jgi:hypothetical protein
MNSARQNAPAKATNHTDHWIEGVEQLSFIENNRRAKPDRVPLPAPGSTENT